MKLTEKTNYIKLLWQIFGLKMQRNKLIFISKWKIICNVGLIIKFFAYLMSSFLNECSDFMAVLICLTCSALTVLLMPFMSSMTLVPQGVHWQCSYY